MICEIVGVFGNTLTANGKYPVQDCENLLSLIQMQLCKKRKKCVEFFAPYLKCSSNVKRFEKNDDGHC